MKFTQENAKDIEKYFLHTFMKFPSFSGDIIHFVDSVSSLYVKGRLWNGEEEEEFEFLLRPEEGPDVEYIMPIKSFFQHEGEAHYMFRVPARQYQRGVNSQNTCLLKLGAHDGFDNVTITFQRLASYVGKQAFPSLAMFKGEKSMALSPRMAVSGGGCLYIDRNLVGNVDLAKKEVLLKERVFAPEIQAIVNAAPGWTLGDKQPAPKKKRAKKITDKYGVDDEGNVVELEVLNGEF